MIDTTSILEALGTLTTGVGGTVVVMLKAWSKDRARRDRLAAAERDADRLERQSEHVACEARFKALSEEISKVRDQYNANVVGALRESSVAMNTASIAQQEGNRILNRVCQRLDQIPLQEAFRHSSASLREATPLATDALPERHP